MAVWIQTIFLGRGHLPFSWQGATLPQILPLVACQGGAQLTVKPVGFRNPPSKRWL